MRPPELEKPVRIVFDCTNELQLQRREWIKHRLRNAMPKHHVALADSLCKQALPFIAIGGIDSIFKGIAAPTTSANIMDSLLDGIVGVSNRDLYWPELTDYCNKEGDPLEPYEAVLDWLPSEIINEAFDFVSHAVSKLGDNVVAPIIQGKRYEVLDVSTLDVSNLCINVILKFKYHTLLTF